MDKRIATDLSTLLSDERAAITTGNFEKLTALTVRKEELLLALPASELPSRLLSDFAETVEGNQVLLTAAMRGISAAQDRMALLDQVRKESNVYSSNGQVTQMTSEHPTHKRKA